MDQPPPLETLIARHLTAQLGDAATAEALTAILLDDALTWQAPTVPLAEVRTIIGFTFGNRMCPNGNREPGPVNQALGDIAVRLHAATRARIFAQWEVAEAIGGRLPADRLVPIYPERGPDAEPRYLNTAGVVDALLAAEPAGLGTVAVVAVRDHAWRCVEIFRTRGLPAGLPEGFAMPDTYDAASGQPWTRDRLTYLLHDLHCRALDRRDALAAARPAPTSFVRRSAPAAR